MQCQHFSNSDFLQYCVWNGTNINSRSVRRQTLFWPLHPYYSLCYIKGTALSALELKVSIGHKSWAAKLFNKEVMPRIMRCENFTLHFYLREKFWQKNKLVSKWVEKLHRTTWCAWILKLHSSRATKLQSMWKLKWLLSSYCIVHQYSDINSFALTWQCNLSKYCNSSSSSKYLQNTDERENTAKEMFSYTVKVLTDKHGCTTSLTRVCTSSQQTLIFLR